MRQSLCIVTDEQRRNRPKVGLPTGWVTFGLQLRQKSSTYRSVRQVCFEFFPCFAPKLTQPKLSYYFCVSQ